MKLTLVVSIRQEWPSSAVSLLLNLVVLKYLLFIFGGKVLQPGEEQ